MDLVYSVALLGLAMILFVTLLLGNRMPDQPRWASDGTTAELSCVAVAGLIAYGMAFGVRFVVYTNELVMGPKEIALVAATLAACYLIFRWLAPRRRLAEYAGELARGRGINESSPANGVALASPENKNGPSSEPTLSKAA